MKLPKCMLILLSIIALQCGFSRGQEAAGEIGATFVVEFPGKAPLGLSLSGANPVKVTGFQRDRNGLAQAGEEDGRIKIGDELLSFNNVRIKTVNDVVAQIRRTDVPVRRLLFRAFDGERRETIADSGTKHLMVLNIQCPRRSSGWLLTSLATDTKQLDLPQTPAQVIGALPADGCGELSNEADIRGAVVLVARGKCSFHEKAFNLQVLGARGVVIMNEDNDLTEQVTASLADGAEITIPVGLITSGSGSIILNTIKGFNRIEAKIGCLIVSRSRDIKKQLEFPVGDRDANEKEYSYWLRQYEAEHPEEVQDCDSAIYQDVVSADALEIYFHLNSIPEAKLALHDYASTSVNEFLADTNGRKVEGLLAGFGMKVQTCVWPCTNQQSSGETMFLESNKTALGVVGLSDPFNACSEENMKVVLPDAIESALKAGSVLGPQDRGLLVVVSTRGGDCHFDKKLENIHNALQRQLGESSMKQLILLHLTVNNENGLFVMEPTLSSASKQFESLGASVMIPKFSDRLVGALVERTLDTHSVMATVKLASLEVHVEPDSSSKSLKSKVAKEWQNIQLLTEDITLWKTNLKERKKQYKQLALLNHPDKGGSQDRFEALLFAYKKASFLLDRDNDDSLESFDDMA